MKKILAHSEKDVQKRRAAFEEWFAVFNGHHFSLEGIKQDQAPGEAQEPPHPVLWRHAHGGHYPEDSPRMVGHIQHETRHCATAAHDG